jgi:UDP-N-acetylmuramoyl-tripeptide--D-alanyl-D-alanine ligase
MNTQQLYELYLKNPEISTDTRTIHNNAIYFALKGPHFNGNLFVKQALEAGASYCITDEATLTDTRVIRTDNVLTTLQNLAGFHRERLHIPVIAITGSNGKTTTKELTHAVLSTTFNTYTTTGNLNNHIGVPLTLLKIKPDAEMAIVEMGANHIGEIAGYCVYTKPTHGLITNCGKAHLEGFGSLDGVKKAKGELFDYLRAHNGTAFVNAGLDYLVQMSRGIENTLLYGKPSNQYYGEAISGLETLHVKMQDNQIIKTKLAGDYNLNNVLSAYTIGAYFHVPENKIIEAIQRYTPENHRSQWTFWNENKVLLDAYNANPGSMQAAIENFEQLPFENKILALGAMKEMGNESDAEHEKLMHIISRYNWKMVVLVGDEFKNVREPYYHFRNSEEAGQWLKNQSVQNSCILIKGSRGSKMEKILEY